MSSERFRTIWPNEDGESVGIVDQTRLPHQLERATLASLADAAHAIRAMQVRGAPLIGATAAYGLALAMRDDPSDAHLREACERLLSTRPTAVNLRWALDRMRGLLSDTPPADRAARALAEADEIAQIGRASCRERV